MTMKFKGTPGPYEVKPYVDAIDIIAADGSLIAHVADRDVSSVGMPPDNAKLLAASWDLLEALRDAQRSLAHFVDATVIPDTTVMQAFTQAKLAESKARAAIAKATTT